MANEPLLSVCVQTFQHREFIGKCLDSILSQQTDFPFEIILGEDDSTDGTREICMEYARAHPSVIRLFLRSEKDKVYVFGSKTGRFNFISNLKAARGKYIALLDGDDYIIDEHKFQKQVDLLERNSDLSVCFHQVYIEDRRKSLRGRRAPRIYLSKCPPLPDKPTVYTLRDEVNTNLISMSSCMFLRSCVDPLPDWFWEVPMIDYPLHIQNAKQGKIGYLPDPMTVYVWHDESMWSSKGQHFQDIKHWQLFTILARNHTGELAEAFGKKRLNVGGNLVRYYRSHVWEDSGWFSRELQEGKFEQDADLLASLQAAAGWLDYINIGAEFVKDRLKKLLRRYKSHFSRK